MIEQKIDPPTWGFEILLKFTFNLSMYKYERGILSKVSNEGESVGKLVISSNRLDCNGFGGWPQIGFATVVL